MREIKFRAWIEAQSPNKSEFYKGTMVDWNILSANFIEKNPHIHFMQFTGLLDKNGKEIYEGDICSYLTSNLIKMREKVVFKSCKFCFHNYDYCLSDYKGLEVIGNIYDNPELLENR